MIMGKFYYEDLGEVLQSVRCLSWNIPVDGSKGMLLGPCVPVHELLLADAWAASSCCLLELLGEALRDSFTIDSSEADLGGRIEWDEFGGCCIVVEVLVCLWQGHWHVRSSELPMVEGECLYRHPGDF